MTQGSSGEDRSNRCGWRRALGVAGLALLPACSPSGARQADERVPFTLRDTSRYESMIAGGERAVLERGGAVLDTVDLWFGVHALGGDTLLFLPVRTTYFERGPEGDSTGYPNVTEHVLWTGGARRPLKELLPHFEPYFSSPVVEGRTIHYWGIRPLRPEGGTLQLYAARRDFATQRLDTLPLDTIALHTDDRGILAPPVVSGDGHVVLRAPDVGFRVAPDYRSFERLP